MRFLDYYGHIGTLLVAIIAANLLAASAGAFERYVPASPASDSEAFSIRIGDGETVVTVAELEESDLYEIMTKSPWEEGDLTFQGVLLRDFLRAYDLLDSDEIVIRAIDNYTQIIPREDWTDWPVMLATRQDGQPLSRRMQGPARLIYPITDHPELDNPVHKTRWVWLIDSIEPVNKGF